MTYGNVYVARVAFGAKDAQTVKALLEAESYPGPSLDHRLLALHRARLRPGAGPAQQKRAVETGYWPLFRHDPRRAAPGESPLKLDSAAPKGRLVDHLRVESRFRAIEQEDPDRFRMLADAAQAHVHTHYALYESLARSMTLPGSSEPAPASTPASTPSASTPSASTSTKP
jgi:pyruvate-ferredoxin/flavodoxin oxidoreductase